MYKQRLGLPPQQETVAFVSSSSQPRTVTLGVKFLTATNSTLGVKFLSATNSHPWFQVSLSHEQHPWCQVPHSHEQSPLVSSFSQPQTAPLVSSSSKPRTVTLGVKFLTATNSHPWCQVPHSHEQSPLVSSSSQPRTVTCCGLHSQLGNSHLCSSCLTGHFWYLYYHLTLGQFSQKVLTTGISCVCLTVSP